MTHSTGVPTPNRALALDALRGLAILAMLLSGQLPFDEHALPAWMYHAQVPPPNFQFNGALPGITWVDLVFPFFLFAMGAALPLALARRIEAGVSKRKLAAFVVERGALLGFFALFVQAIRPYTLSAHPTTTTWLVALLGFAILFPILTRLPEGWPRAVRYAIRGGGWIGAALFLATAVYPDGTGFKLGRSDIIIVVLTNMAVFGSIVWLVTRAQLLPRLGLLGLLLAIRLSNMPNATEGWVHDVWMYSPLPWLYQLYYLQYLCIVIPGTIAGDLILKWTREVPEGAEKPAAGRPLLVGACMLALVFLVVIGLKARWLIGTTLLTFALCVAGWKLLNEPRTKTEQLHKELFNWAIYWLVLGLFFEPYEGGIRKDRATVSYYFVTAGLAICVFIGFSILIDVLRKRRVVQLLVDNGQNPMVAYAGINNFITPVLALTGADLVLSQCAYSPWRGFIKGLIVTLLMGLTTAFLTRRRILWRT